MEPRQLMRHPSSAEAKQFDGENYAEIVNFVGMACTWLGNQLWIGDPRRYVQPGEWVVKAEDGAVSVLDEDEMNAQYLTMETQEVESSDEAGPENDEAG